MGRTVSCGSESLVLSSLNGYNVSYAPVKSTGLAGGQCSANPWLLPTAV